MPAIAEALDDIGHQLAAVQGMKAKLTSISTAARDISSAMDLLRAGVLRGVKAVEEQLRAVEPGEVDSLSA